MTPDFQLPAFAQRGIEILEEFLTDAQCDQLRRLCEPLLKGAGPDRRPGVRRVLQREPRILEVLRSSQVPRLAAALCGPGARIVRSILFDKSPATNWLVPWHQDATIAVAERIDSEGFGPWSVKDGEHHCRPPRKLLDRIVVIRLHLDPCGPANGPLRVVADSHALGLLPADAVERAAAAGEVVECCVGAGAAVVMFPHSIHASPKAAVPSRRRVLHIECTACDLPDGLRWAELEAFGHPGGTLAV